MIKGQCKHQEHFKKVKRKPQEDETVAFTAKGNVHYKLQKPVSLIKCKVITLDFRNYGSRFIFGFYYFKDLKVNSSSCKNLEYRGSAFKL